MSELSPQALNLLKKRYFRNGENWPGLCKRVTKAVAKNSQQEEEFCKVLFNRTFLPNTPALVNLGKKDPQCFACFVCPIEDSIEGIFKTLTNTAKIYQTGGGVGINFSTLRPEGSKVGTHGTSSGPISFMKIFDEMTGQLKQGGIRRGAALGLLSVDHPDIVKFIKCKNNQTELTNFNISVAITDEFMDQLKQDMNKPKGMNDHTWVCKFNGNDYRINAKTDQPKMSIYSNAPPMAIVEPPYYTVPQIWDLICQQSHKNGEPGIVFIDEVKRKNGKEINCCNPCQPKNALLLDSNRLRKISDGGKLWTSWKTGIKPIIELTCNNGLQFECTPDHKIQLETGKFIAAKDCLDKPLKWGLGNRRKHITDVKQVLRGFLFGDGVLTGRKQGVSVKLDRIKEPEVWELLTKFGFYQQPSGSYYINRKTLEKIIDISFLQYRVWVRDLPDDILYGSNKKTGSFLLGLLSANGSCNHQGQGCLKATCGKAISKVQLLLSSFGIPSWLSPNKPQEIKWLNGTYTSKKSFNLQIAPRNMHLLRNNIGGFLHKSKLANIREPTSSYKTKLKVISIKSLGEKEVWDYRMKKVPHCNFCQGVILANCGEQFLEDYEACCLGSIDVSKFVKPNDEHGNTVDYKGLEKVVKTAVRFLDRIIDISRAPLEEINKKVQKNRKIGLGIMGFADYLIKREVSYNSDEAREYADILMGFIQKWALEESAGRNKEVTTIAPTGSVSIIAGCSSGIEPNHSWVTEVNRPSFKGTIIHPLAQEYIDDPTKPPPRHFVTASQVSWEDHVKMQAVFQRYISNSISKTINMSKSATVGDVSDAFKLAHSLSCKGVTVYRDKSRDEQVLTEVTSTNNNTNKIHSKYSNTMHSINTPQREGEISNVRPYKLPGITFKLKIEIDGKLENMYLTVSLLDSKPYEVFLAGNIRDTSKIVAQYIDTTTRLASLSMRRNVPLQEIIQQLEKTPSTYLYSIPIKIASVLKEFLEVPDIPACPECKAPVVYSEGCYKCSQSCGFEKCS